MQGTEKICVNCKWCWVPNAQYDKFSTQFAKCDRPIPRNLVTGEARFGGFCMYERYQIYPEGVDTYHGYKRLPSYVPCGPGGQFWESLNDHPE